VKIIADDARPLGEVRKSVPPNVAAAVGKALEKLPADRFESAEAFADALADPAFRLPGREGVGAGGVSWSGSVGWRGRLRDPVFIGVSLVALAALAVAALGWPRPQPEVPGSAQRIVLWQHPLGGRLLDPGESYEATQAAIAPDGSSIVFVDSTGGTFHLMRKLRSQPSATLLAGTEGALSPFFSPDGDWIGYVSADGKLKKVPVAGGGSVTLADVPGAPIGYGTAAAWLDDDSLVFLGNAGIEEVGASGGRARVLRRRASFNDGGVITMWPLPKSRGIVYTECPGNCSVASSIHVLDLRSDSDRVLVPNAAGAWYSPTGDLLYTARGGGLYAMAFDADRLEVTGGPVSVIPDVVPGTFTLSGSGDILYTTATSAGSSSELMWVSRDGTAVPLDSTWKADFQYPALSPDGKSLAVSVVGATTQLWIRRSDGTRQQLTQDGVVNWRPAWTRDSRSVVFSSNRSGADRSDAYDLYEMPADGSAPARLLLDNDHYGIWEGELSPDGRWLAFRWDSSAVSQIWARRLEGDTALVRLPDATGVGTAEIALSPDGGWLAYQGASGIEVAPFPALAPTRVVSHGGGTEPRWAGDGRTLFYRSGDRLMAVPITPGSTLQFGSPRALFSMAGYRAARNRQEYDVAPDGQHFVMIRNLPNTSSTVVYVENWFPELLAKVKE
jgi:serine/threonine-protein kinase